MKAHYYVAVALLLAACGRANGPAQIEAPMPEAFNAVRLAISGPVVIIGHDRTKNLDTIQVQGNAIRSSDICTALDAYRDESRNGVIIKAAPDAKYGTVLLVISAAQSAGFTEFGLANKARGVVTDVGALAGFQKVMPRPTPPNVRVLITYKHMLDVEVSDSNRIWIDGKPTSASKLYHDLAQAVAVHHSHEMQGYSTHIWLYGDDGARWDTIIKILDAARQAGDDDAELNPHMISNGNRVSRCPV